MIRGTTPTHIFTFEEINPADLKQLNIYYAQQGIVLLTKTKSDCVITTVESENKTTYNVAVTLTQEETNLFRAKYDVEIQVRILTPDNVALATPKYRLSIHDVLNDEVLT